MSKQVQKDKKKVSSDEKKLSTDERKNLGRGRRGSRFNNKRWRGNNKGRPGAKKTGRKPMPNLPAESVTLPPTWRPGNGEPMYFAPPPDPNARKFVDIMKGLGPSAMSSDAGGDNSDLISPSCNNVLDLLVPIDSGALEGLCCGILAYAYTRGYGEYTAGGSHADYPWWAFLGLFEAFASAVRGNTADIPKIQIPLFVNDIIAALSPKANLRLPAGKISYTWDSNDVTVPSAPALDFPGTLVSGIKFYNYIDSATTALGYNQQTTPNTNPSPTQKANAMSDLFRYMSSRSYSGWNPWKLVDLDAVKSPLFKSASAFSFGSKVIGYGWSGGYPNTIVSSELYIRHPKFGVFAKNVNNKRAFHDHRPMGGDSNFLIGSIVHQLTSKEYKNPCYPIFKPIDFYEFAHRIALYVVELFNLYYSDDSYSNRIVNLGLTPDEFLTIIYHELMLNFSDTQWAVHSMYMYGGTQNSNDPFIPFVVSSNTAASGSSYGMTFPLIVCENLNSLRGRTIYPYFDPSTGKNNRAAPRRYYPVLGKYANSAFDPKNYYYSAGEENTTSIFTTDTLSGINYVDGTYQNTPLDLATSSSIQKQKEIWNTVMTTLNAFIQSPGFISTDPGVNVLALSAETYIITQDKQDFLLKKMSSKKGKEKVCCEPEGTVYLKRYESYTSQFPSFTCLDESKNALIRPEMLVLDGQQGSGSIDSTTVRSLNYEMNINWTGKKINANTGTYTEAATVWKSFVSLCVKSRTSSDVLLVRQLAKLSEWGKGGLLNDLVQTFGHQIGNAAGAFAGSAVKSFIL